MDYIHQPGDPQGRPPYVGQNVLMHGGFFDGDGDVLQGIVDEVFNGVDPDLHFTVLVNKVMYAALYAEKMRSANPADPKGYVPESDIGLWIATLGGRAGRLPAIRFMPVFIFVDSPPALMTGREFYGYPKQMGRMTRTGVDDADFGVELFAGAMLRDDDPDEKGVDRRILSVVRREGAGDAPASDLDAAMAPLRALFGEALAAIGAVADAALSANPAPYLGMPQMFLRQMRDVTALDAAQVREVVTTTVGPTSTAGAGLAPAHQITFHPTASYPMAKVLGVAGDPKEDVAADLSAQFWVRFDFEVGPGARL